MSMSLLFLLAVVSMVTLAAGRVVRVHYGRAPLPELGGRTLFVLAFFVVPPVALGALIHSADGSRLDGFASVPAYALLVAGLAILMGVFSLGVPLVTPRRWRPLMLLALIGSEPDPDDVPYDPPLTAPLAESVAIVEQANAAFPRGPEFPIQIDSPGFRVAWDALETATVVLEGRIAGDRGLGMPVASKARSLAIDARSRLDTLRRLSREHGHAWAS